MTFRGQWYKIIYRRAWRKFLTVFVAVLSRLNARINAAFTKYDTKLYEMTHRPFRLAGNPQAPKFPTNMLTATTKLALQVLGEPKPTTKDIVLAIQRSDKVRGDGKLPERPAPVTRLADETKAEVGLGLFTALNSKRDIASELVELEEEVDGLIHDLTAAGEPSDRK